MTLLEAVKSLIEDYELESFIDLIRDDAKYDESFTGLSQDHPRVKRFQEICQVLRAAVEE